LEVVAQANRPFVDSQAAVGVKPLAASNPWQATGSMKAPHWAYAAAKLSDGRVLVASDDASRGEIYDPFTGTWSLTGFMNIGHGFAATGTLLADGKFLYDDGNGGAQAEIYDPVSNTWSLTGNMQLARDSGGPLLTLQSGKVLLIGGRDLNLQPTSETELYDPGTGLWTVAAPMHLPRYLATATLLGDGRVLVVGGVVCVGQTNGCNTNTAEIYDPALNIWSFTMSMSADRSWHDAILLENGTVLVAGGNSDIPGASGTAEIYDPLAGTWQSAAVMPHSRIGLKLARLPNGTVLAIGGEFGGGVKQVDQYLPATNSWQKAGSIPGRTYFSAITLNNGDVLVPGGRGNFKVLKTAHRYQFTP